MRYNPFGYQGVPNQRKFRAAATGRPLQWARSDRPAALAAYLNDRIECKTRKVSAAIPPRRRSKVQIGCGPPGWRLQEKPGQPRQSIAGRQPSRGMPRFMDQDELTHLLEAVAAGALSTADAALRIRTQPYVDAGGFAKVDLHRRVRCGFPEVIFGQGKTAQQIEAILRTLITHGQGGLVTRVEPAAAAHLGSAFPEGQYNQLGRTFRVESPEAADAKVGRVVIVTAGTSDLPVAEEARVTAEAWNCEVALVAGMEGALPSVVGGMVDCPVIAVPTSIGYGAHFHGLAALLGMLNSCASNVVVVNIDAGFNGGHVAGLIARRAGLARLSSTAAATGPAQHPVAAAAGSEEPGGAAIPAVD